MPRMTKLRLLLIWSLIIASILSLLSGNIAAVQAEPFSKIKEKMTQTTEKEKEVLKKLFLMVQEIEVMETEAAGNAKDLERIKREIDGLRTKIADEKIVYAKKQENLKQVLKSYQRSGPGSYLEIILDSDSLSTLIRRINILRDITHNTGELLTELEESRNRQAAEESKLAEKLTLLEDKQKKLTDALNKKKQIKADMDKYLLSLGSDREYYQEYLANIEKLWDELKSLFSDTMKELSKTIEENKLPEDAVKITFNLLGIKGSLDEKTLNDVISANSQMIKMNFKFSPGKVEMQVPEKELTFLGTFIIIDGHILKLKVEAGTFYGMPLEDGAIEELFNGDYLQLDFKPVLYGYDISSIEIMDGELRMSFTP